MSELLATHVNAAIDALPAAVCVGSEATATRALRRVLGFCQLLASRLPAVLTADRLWEERALDLYEQQKQMLAIRDVSTVAVLTGAPTRGRHALPRQLPPPQRNRRRAPATHRRNALALPACE